MAFQVQVRSTDASAGTADSSIVTTPYPTPPEGIVCKVYNGTSWDTATVKVWDGSAWQTATPKVYDGSVWNG